MPTPSALLSRMENCIIGDRVSYSLGWPLTHCVAGDDLGPLILLLLNTGITGLLTVLNAVLRVNQGFLNVKKTLSYIPSVEKINNDTR